MLVCAVKTYVTTSHSFLKQDKVYKPRVQTPFSFKSDHHEMKYQLILTRFTLPTPLFIYSTPTTKYETLHTLKGTVASSNSILCESDLHRDGTHQSHLTLQPLHWYQVCPGP